MESLTTIRETTREMAEILRAHIEGMPVDEFLIARKFLDCVDYAAHKIVSR